MNIYLDIDGVLLTKNSLPANYAGEFLKYILNNYPDNTYWLTTRCQGDANKPIQQIGSLFDNETIALMKMIKPTTWLTSSKAEAIDFTKPFLWFDDNMFIADRQILDKNSALDNWVKIDLKKYPDMLGELIENFPIPIECL